LEVQYAWLDDLRTEIDLGTGGGHFESIDCSLNRDSTYDHAAKFPEFDIELHVRDP
jgi:hypothetical protein